MSQHTSAHAARSHKLRNTLLVITALLILLIIAGGVVGLNFYKQAKEVKAHEEQAVSSLSAITDVNTLKDAQASDAAIKQAQTHTAAARDIANGTLWNMLSKMPVVGGDVTNVQGMTQVVDDLVQQTLPSLTDVVQQLANAQISGENGQLNLQPIVDVQDDFSSVSKQVKSLNSKLSNLPEPRIGMVKKAYSQSRSQFTKVTDMVEQVNNALQMLPSFLGQNGARTYLLVAQTTSEQRSGGGLVGSMGTLQTDHGQIQVGEFHHNEDFINGSNGNASEHAVFKRPLGFSFDIRDTFAVPDIARNAEMMNEAWQRSQYACDVDGIVSVDPVFIQKMVEINGNVTLENGTVLTSENTAEYMLNTIYKEVPVSLQDTYFEYIASTIMNKAFSNMDIAKMMKVAQSIGELTKNRHFYAYTFHDDEAKYFQGAGLAKGTPDSETDPEVGIYLNEQNPSKLGWYIDRKAQITKTGQNADGSKTYHVTYTLTNTLTSSEMATCTGYILGGEQAGVTGKPVAAPGTSAQRMLFYAPKGGSISEITSSGDVRDQSNAVMDDQKLVTNVAYIAPGESVTFDFDVTTSPKAESDLTIDQTPSGKMTNEVNYQY